MLCTTLSLGLSRRPEHRRPAAHIRKQQVVRALCQGRPQRRKSCLPRRKRSPCSSRAISMSTRFGTSLSIPRGGDSGRFYVALMGAAIADLQRTRISRPIRMLEVVRDDRRRRAPDLRRCDRALRHRLRSAALHQIASQLPPASAFLKRAFGFPSVLKGIICHGLVADGADHRDHQGPAGSAMSTCSAMRAPMGRNMSMRTSLWTVISSPPGPGRMHICSQASSLR